MPKVLISSPSFDSKKNVSGVSKVVFELTRALRDRVDFSHVQLGSHAGANGRISFSSRFTGLFGAIVVLRSDARIYHSNTALNLKSLIRDTLLCFLARCSGKKIVLHTHGGYYLDHHPTRYVRILVKTLVYLSDKVVALSGTELTLLQKYYGIDSTKADFVYNFVRRPKINTRPPNKEEAPLRVAFVGRLVPVKGIDRFIAVAEAVPSDAASFRVYGDGELRNLVERKAADGTLSFMGVFDIDESAEVMRSIDIILLLSTSGEGMPMVVLEAMNSGAIPIVTALGSLTEVVVHGDNGFIVGEDAVEEATEILISLAKDRERVGRISRRAMEVAINKFGEDVNAKRMLSIYSCLDGN